MRAGTDVARRDADLAAQVVVAVEARAVDQLVDAGAPRAAEVVAPREPLRRDREAAVPAAHHRTSGPTRITGITPTAWRPRRTSWAPMISTTTAPARNRRSREAGVEQPGAEAEHDERRDRAGAVRRHRQCTASRRSRSRRRRSPRRRPARTAGSRWPPRGGSGSESAARAAACPSPATPPGRPAPPRATPAAAASRAGWRRPRASPLLRPRRASPSASAARPRGSPRPRRGP